MPRHRLSPLNLATDLSILLLLATTAGWVVGAVRGKHSTVWTVHARPERSVFIRFARQHLILCEQRLDATGMPSDYAMDSTCFREFSVVGPLLPRGGGVTLHEDSFLVSPEGAWFRRLRVQPAGIRFANQDGSTWQARGFFNALEIPWWSLVVVFSLLPASRWVAARRRRMKVRRGLCPD